MPSTKTPRKLSKTKKKKLYTSLGNNIVMNLSNFDLSTRELSVLNKGLTFIPTPETNIAINTLPTSLQNLFNKMSTIYYFHNKEINAQISLYMKTNWQPPQVESANLKLYYHLTSLELDNFISRIKNIPIKNNTSIFDKKAIKNLRTNKNIVIKKADKGSAIVIMDKPEYLKKVYSHLNNREAYEKLTNTEEIMNTKTLINSFLEFLEKKGHITHKTRKFMSPPENHRLGLFYILPKIHKKEIPGRPIVSSINSLTQNISRFLSLCIANLVPKLESYIKNTKHFLQKIISKKKIIGKDTFLVSIDVTALYTNIPHEEGINACLYYIEKYRNELPHFVPNKTIMKTLFLFVLENNFFEFDNIIYKQLFGTSMGTIMAPQYANLFLGYLEEKKILNTRFRKFMKIFLRFLDDIFLVWSGSENELKSFINYLNQIHDTIKFTHTYSKKEVTFLDTTIYKNQKTHKLQSKLYTKPTDTKTLLHYKSYHPLHTKKSIIYSQAIRYRMIITNNRILETHLKDLKKTFQKRGYPLNIINTEINKVKSMTQRQLLINTNHIKQNNYQYRNKKASKKTLPFITPYSEHSKSINTVLNKHWNIIKEDSELCDIFPNKPFIAYTRHKNLKDILISSKFGS